MENVIVDKHHITAIVRKKGDQAIPIYDVETLPKLFHQNPRISAIVADFRLVMEIGEDDDEPGSEVTQDAAPGNSAVVTGPGTPAGHPATELTSAGSGRIIDAEDGDLE